MYGTKVRTIQASPSWTRRLRYGLALLVCAAVPALLCQLLRKEPQERSIHMEAFRYGKDPAVIRCQRGDRLHLTFSARDTGHSFFLEEFDVDAKITPFSDEVPVFRTSAPELPPTRTREVVLVAEHPGWLGWLVSKSTYRCHVWCGPMHAFEHGHLIIEPNTLLYAALGALAGVPLLGLLSLRRTLRRGVPDPPAARGPGTGNPHEGLDLLRRFPWLKRLVQRREFQFLWIAAGAAVFWLVLLTTLLGTHVAGRNLGSMLLWVLWLFLLAAVLTPLGGRLWCLACPLPALGESLQRRAFVRVRQGTTGRFNNRFFGLNLPWPRALDSAWPRTVAFLALGTFSTLWVASPRATGWLLLGMALLGAAMALVWELRSFCRYLCPINAFIGLYAMAGKLAVRAADPATCASCTVHTCLRGDARGWACPYGLCLSEVKENNDCGMCMECTKSCAYDNVALLWRPLGEETRIRTTGEAFQAISMLVLAAAYCAVHLGPWPAVRDSVNILDKGNWGGFALFTVSLWSAALFAAPGTVLLAAALSRRLAGLATPLRDLFTASAGALVPLGLGLWIAFVVPLLTANGTFILQSVSDPFGWGWNLLGTRSSPWHQLWPRAVPWIQVACVLAGLHFSLRNGWRIWVGLAGDPRRALRGSLPVATMLLVVAAGLVVFFAD